MPDDCIRTFFVCECEYWVLQLRCPRNGMTGHCTSWVMLRSSSVLIMSTAFENARLGCKFAVVGVESFRLRMQGRCSAPCLCKFCYDGMLFLTTSLFVHFEHALKAAWAQRKKIFQKKLTYVDGGPNARNTKLYYRVFLPTENK